MFKPKLPAKLYPGAKWFVDEPDDITPMPGKFTLDEFKRLLELGVTENGIDEMIQLGSVYDQYSPAQRDQKLEDLIDLIDAKKGVAPRRVTWSRLMNPKDDEVNDRLLSAIVSPVELRITRSAFDSCGTDKKALLRSIRKRAALAKFEDLQNEVPQTLVWYFEAEEFLRVTTEYPWLLDSNLGEKINDGPINSYLTSKSAWFLNKP
jgi:hypothetical protein